MSQTEKSSILSSTTVLAAIISGTAAVLAAVLPWLLGTRGEPRANYAIPAEAVLAPASARPALLTSTLAQATLPAAVALPNLTLGTWTVVNSVDDAGTDFTGSTLKFVSQREASNGLEAIGFFEWRSGEYVHGREHVVANYDPASRQLFIEGNYVESPDARLAVGSFSARLSEDGRKLLEGTWGNTAGNQAGILGKWEARR